ncbi:MAG: hypothetical protein AB7O98_13940 [Hyphomonadaceae bacterium]
MSWVVIASIAVIALVIAVAIYLTFKFYSTTVDYTHWTQNDRGYRRTLTGRGFILDPEEFVVKGDHAPRIEFPAIDPATGGRKSMALMDRKSGRISLRPHICTPLPFRCHTADDHAIMAEARVQFKLDVKKMKFVHHWQDMFGAALEQRIQSALRAEVGQLEDQQLRKKLNDVEDGALRRLRFAEENGDEEHEDGYALGVKFIGVTFDYTPGDYAPSQQAQMVMGGDAPMMAVAASGDGATPAAPVGVRHAVRVGPMSLTPQQIDKLADQFETKTPHSTAALLTLMEMQTRQNIAEALAGSGQLVVVTPQDLGLAGASVHGQMIERLRAQSSPPGSNGA